MCEGTMAYIPSSKSPDIQVNKELEPAHSSRFTLKTYVSDLKKIRDLMHLRSFLLAALHLRLGSASAVQACIRGTGKQTHADILAGWGPSATHGETGFSYGGLESHGGKGWRVGGVSVRVDLT